MSTEQVLRAAIVKRMFGYSYEQLAFHLMDSISLRCGRFAASAWRIRALRNRPWRKTLCHGSSCDVEIDLQLSQITMAQHAQPLKCG
jgi:hypothetical protein